MGGLSWLSFSKISTKFLRGGGLLLGDLSMEEVDGCSSEEKSIFGGSLGFWVGLEEDRLEGDFSERRDGLVGRGGKG